MLGGPRAPQGSRGGHTSSPGRGCVWLRQRKCWEEAEMAKAVEVCLFMTVM